MEENQPEPEDGSLPERGTGQRQDHRTAPPGHEIPRPPEDLDEAEEPEQDEQEERSPNGESG